MQEEHILLKSTDKSGFILWDWMYRELHIRQQHDRQRPRPLCWGLSEIQATPPSLDWQKKAFCFLRWRHRPRLFHCFWHRPRPSQTGTYLHFPFAWTGQDYKPSTEYWQNQRLRQRFFLADRNLVYNLCIIFNDICVRYLHYTEVSCFLKKNVLYNVEGKWRQIELELFISEDN